MTQDVSHPRAFAWRSASVVGWARSTVLERPIRSIVVIGLTLRVLVALGAWIVYGGIVFGDDGTYHELARMMVQGETEVWTTRDHWLYTHVGGFTYPLTALYWLFGPTPLAGQLLAAVFGTTAAVLTYLLSRRVVSEQLAVAAGLVVALLPSQILFSSLNLKDPEIWAVLVGIGVLVAKAATARDVRSAVLWTFALVPLLLLLGFLRAHTHIIALWAVVPAFLFGADWRRWTKTGTVLLMALLLPWVAGFGLGGFRFVLDQATGVDEVRDFMAMGATTAVVPDISQPDSSVPGGSGGDAQVPYGGPGPRDTPPPSEPAGRAAAPPRPPNDPRYAYSDQFLAHGADANRPSRAYSDQFLAHDTLHPDRTRRAYSDQFLAHDIVNPPRVQREAGSDDPLVDNLKHLPTGIMVALLEPLPWRDGNIRTDLARAETLIWYPLLLLGLVGIPYLLRRPEVGVYPVLFAGGAVLIMALAEGNYGTAFRHRGEVVWVVVLSAAVGVAQIRAWIRSAGTDAS